MSFVPSVTEPSSKADTNSRKFNGLTHRERRELLENHAEDVTSLGERDDFETTSRAALETTRPGAVRVSARRGDPAEELTVQTDQTALSVGEGLVATPTLIRAELAPDTEAIIAEALQRNAEDLPIAEAEKIKEHKSCFVSPRFALVTLGLTVVFGAVAVTLGVLLAPEPSPAPKDPFAINSTIPTSEYTPTPSSTPSLAPTELEFMEAIATLQVTERLRAYGLNWTNFGISVATSQVEESRYVAIASGEAVIVMSQNSGNTGPWEIVGDPIILLEPLENGELHGGRQMLDMKSAKNLTSGLRLHFVSIAADNRVDVYRFDEHGNLEGVSTESVWFQVGNPLTDLLATDDCCGMVVAKLAFTTLTEKLFLAIATTSTDGVESEYGYTALFQLDGEQWNLVGDERIPGFHQYSYQKAISINEDATVMAVGNPSEIGTGEVRIYQREGYCTGSSYWCQLGSPLIGGDYEDIFGSTLALSGSGTRLVIGAPGIIQCTDPTCSRVWVYDYASSNDVWLQAGQVLGENASLTENSYSENGFGHVVDVSSDGRTIVVTKRGFSSDIGLYVYQSSTSGLWTSVFEWTETLSEIWPFISMDFSESTLALGISQNGSNVVHVMRLGVA